MTEPTSYGKKAMTGEATRIRLSEPGTRNEVLNKAAYALGTLIPDHLSESLAMATLTDAALITTADGKDTDPLTEEEVASTIASGMQAGMSNPRRVPHGYVDREDALDELDRIGQTWDVTPMGGWEGRRCKQVMPGILRIAYQVGGPRNVPLPITRLGIEAGTSNRDLIQKAVKDLKDMQWLSLSHLGGPGRGSRYHLHIPPGLALRTQDVPTLHTPGMWERPDYAMTGHDAGRPQSLGPAGIRIFYWLANEPGAWRTQASVARVLGVAASTVGRYTKPHRPLIKHGLIEKNDKGRIRATCTVELAVLDITAQRTDALGRRDRDRARLTEYFRDQGMLDEDWHWRDPRDGTRGNTADWLKPERAHLRLQPHATNSKFLQGVDGARLA